MISAFAKASFVLNDEKYKNAAIKSSKFIVKKFDEK